MSPSPPALIAAVLLAISIPLMIQAAQKRRSNSAFKDLPTLPARTLLQQRNSMKRAYDEYLRHGRMCKLEHPAHTLILLPMRLMNEIKGLNEADAGWRGELGERFVTEWTGIAPHGALLEVLRGKQFHAIVSAWIPRLVSECEVMVPDVLQIADDSRWVSVRLQEFSIRAVARLVGLIAGGESLARDERWVRLASTHVYACALAAFALLDWPSWVRPIVGYVHPKVWQLWQDQKDMQAALKPILQERIDAVAQREVGDVVGAVIAHGSKSGTVRISTGLLADHTLSFSNLGAHVISGVLTDTLTRLTAHPEYQEILLEELESTLDGRPFGGITQADLAGLPKLDSFIKESQRLSISMDLSLVRQINRRSGITLSDGTHLPFGSFVGTSGAGVLRDGNIFPDPTRFDGLRYYNMRQRPGGANKHQFVSLGEYDTQFGAGTQACPGRWLAGYEVKLITAWILLFCELDIDIDSSGDLSWVLSKPDARVRIRRKGSA